MQDLFHFDGSGNSTWRLVKLALKSTHFVLVLVPPPSTHEPGSPLREKMHHIFRPSVHVGRVSECVSEEAKVRKTALLPIRPEEQTGHLLFPPIFLADLSV